MFNKIKIRKLEEEIIKLKFLLHKWNVYEKERQLQERQTNKNK